MGAEVSLRTTGGPEHHAPVRRSWADPAFAGLARACGIAVLILISGIIAVMLFGGRQAFSTFGLGFLTSSVWNPVLHHYGALAPMFGTIVTSFIGLVIAVPLAFGVAFCLTEMAPGWLSGPLGTAVELLAAVPSIIFGMWGFFVIVPIMAQHIQPALIHSLGRVPFLHPFFSGAPFGTGLLTGGLILAVMVTPFIAAVMRDVFNSMPPVLKESAYGLGSTRWDVMRRVVLPWSRTAVIGGIMLGLGRALGETMAITFVIGNTNRISASLFSPGNTIASLIALEFPESEAGSLKLSSLLALGFVLMVISFITLACSRALLRRGRLVR
ncbi:phosphate ABC transporter permease subunit PstC [Lichenicola cladoniae]|uniref:Phosphate transport system permease protein n=1 Tax=Lichenicola cladoniae TaxID=1484109 RepID=A0A6M8HUH8_9PROT|nr:phosphate ABC transporter permease subunit PstC [Lichenicola cladoniae]NPD66133.1 phosphate ABC transporter permease subunit PstC [Acetobacteraceae bacterium]QKE92002.1 phosphate ABC transporter permease subunit PstC [Lichenicola cladoniae]